MLFSRFVDSTMSSSMDLRKTKSDISTDSALTSGAGEENNNHKTPHPSELVITAQKDTDDDDDNTSHSTNSSRMDDEEAMEETRTESNKNNNKNSDHDQVGPLNGNLAETAAPRVQVSHFSSVATFAIDGGEKEDKDEEERSVPLHRQKSYMIPSSRNDDEELDEEDEEEIQQKSEPTTLLEVVRHQSTKSNDIPSSANKRRLKAILKRSRPSWNSSGIVLQGAASTTDDETIEQGQKSVRFATNPDDNNSVWCLVQERPADTETKENDDDDDEQQDYANKIWWTEDELDIRYELDAEIVQVAQDTYRDVLSKAFESCSNVKAAEQVDMEFESMAMCAMARGLEGQCYAAELREKRARHYRRVLGFQKLVTDKITASSSDDESDKKKKKKKKTTGAGLNDAETRLLRIQSLKTSRHCQMVAVKMAEYDRLFAAML